HLLPLTDTAPTAIHTLSLHDALPISEHVRVTPDQLGDDPLGHVVHVPIAGVGSHLRVEHDLQQEIAELLPQPVQVVSVDRVEDLDRKSTRLNSSHRTISYAVFCLKKK